MSTMTTAEFVSHLSTLDVKVWPNGDKLGFNAAPGAMTPELRAELVARKAEILRYLREMDSGPRGATPPMPRVDRNGDMPLSHAQVRLWFLDHLDPGSPLYTMVRALRIRGDLSVSALETALRRLVARHESLRCSFHAINGIPVQRVSETAGVELDVEDLTTLPDDDRERHARERATEEARRPFDLAVAPLFRAALFRMASDDHMLVITVHHIAADGWSMGTLVRDLLTLYDEADGGADAQLPKLDTQYLDYASWQRASLKNGALERQLAYWKRRLDGAPPVLELPTDRPRPPAQSYRGSRESVLLAASLADRLEALSRREGVTLFMTLLAGFQTLLYRYTRQTDVVVGTAVANRNRAETEQVVGLFANTLVLRSDLSGDPTFRELLSRVRDVALGAFAHADLPFESLVDEIQPERSLSHNPLFQVIFAFQNFPDSGSRTSRLTVTPVDVHTETAKFDLFLFAERRGEGLSVTLEYSSDLFDPATIRRMLDNFARLLEGAVESPERTLAELPILSDGERHRVLVEWNDTAVAYPESLTVHELFEAQAAARCGEVAVVCGADRVTYGELNERANRLAHYLVKLGVGPDVPVALCLDRSIDTVVALLGILKAGGAYVPLDPTYPEERLRFMLADTAAPVLVAHSHLVDRFATGATRVVALDLESEAIESRRTSNPVSGAGPDHLSYVTYTSGSTGVPKGVEICHRGITRLLFGVDYARLGPSETLLHLAPLPFDASTLEIWGALLHGGRIVVFPDTVPSYEELASVIRDEGVTTLWLTASLYNSCIDVAPETLRGVSQLLIGGEALSVAHVRRGLELLPSTKIVNGYGPTESTTFTCCYPIPADLDPAATSIPIGRPIANTRLYILDERMKPVPIGVPGELYIGGAGLARGYRNRPELTAKRFVSNPFDADPASRLYRTGDMVRYRPDGLVEFIGRADNQVKLHGFRIELGEIEAVLGQHPGVREAVAVVREDEPGKRRLVAYAVAANGVAPSIADVRSFLKQKLPEYMVPSTCVFVDALPLSPNGKADRCALPAPEPATAESAPGADAPMTGVERALAEVWADVLRVESVARDDNFFDLGGDSILSIQIVSRAAKRGLKLTPKQLFQFQTVGELAGHIGAGSAIDAEQGSVTGSVPLTPIQHWFFEQKIANPSHYNQSVVLEAKAPVDPALIGKALSVLVSHHDALRLRFTRGERGWEQLIVGAEEHELFSTVDLSRAVDPESELVRRAAELQTSLDITAGPLLRAVYFEPSDARPGRLLVAVHHLAIDGVSWRVLLEDLETVCAQLSRGQSARLPAKTTSFKTWAERLVARAEHGIDRSERDYWLAVCGSSAPAVPCDRADGANLEGSSRLVAIDLDEEETAALVREVPAAFKTQINDALLAALALAFSEWSGDGRLRVDLEGHGREAIFEGVDVTRTIGWFTTVFPAVIDIGAERGPVAALQTVKAQLGTVPDKGIGYGLLRYLASDGEVAARGDERAAQVSFNYLGRFGDAAGGSLFTPVDSRHGPDRDPAAPRRHLLNVSGSIAGDRLRMTIRYSENLHSAAMIERLASAYGRALRAIAGASRLPRESAVRPSDFPKARINQKDLDRLVARFGMSK